MDASVLARSQAAAKAKKDDIMSRIKGLTSAEEVGEYQCTIPTRV
jgi:hypothetical protein